MNAASWEQSLRESVGCLAGALVGVRVEGYFTYIGAALCAEELLDSELHAIVGAE